MNRREHTGTNHRENRHRFGETVNTRSPILTEQEQYRRDQYRQYHGNRSVKTQQVLEKHHQNADQYETENQLLIDSRAYAGDDVDPEPAGFGCGWCLHGDDGRIGVDRAVQCKTQHYQRYSQQNALYGHRYEIRQINLP